MSEVTHLCKVQKILSHGGYSTHALTLILVVRKWIRYSRSALQRLPMKFSAKIFLEIFGAGFTLVNHFYFGFGFTSINFLYFGYLLRTLMCVWPTTFAIRNATPSRKAPSNCQCLVRLISMFEILFYSTFFVFLMISLADMLVTGLDQS